MNRQRRLAGRAIRRQLREQREAIAALSRIDLNDLGQRMVAAFSHFCRAIEEAVKSIARLYFVLAAAHQSNAEREYRMTYRALTTGGEIPDA